MSGVKHRVRFESALLKRVRQETFNFLIDATDYRCNLMAITDVVDRRSNEKNTPNLGDGVGSDEGGLDQGALFGGGNY